MKSADNTQIPTLLAVADLDPEGLRTHFGHFPTGVAALCAWVDGRPVGMVATSFSVGISFEPPLVLFSIQHSSRTWPQLRTAAQLGVSILGIEQAATCMQLTSRTRDRFEGVDYTRTASDSVLLVGATMWMECSNHTVIAAGDHDIVVLAVEGIELAENTDPFVYHQSRLRTLASIASNQL